MKINIIDAIKSFLKRRETYVESIDACKTVIQQGDYTRIDNYADRVYKENKAKLEKLNSLILNNSEKLAGYFLSYDGIYLQDIVETIEEELRSCEYGSLRWHNLQGKLEGLSVLQKCIIKEEV
jgi:hypothetical protein